LDSTALQPECSQYGVIVGSTVTGSIFVSVFDVRDRFAEVHWPSAITDKSLECPMSRVAKANSRNGEPNCMFSILFKKLVELLYIASSTWQIKVGSILSEPFSRHSFHPNCWRGGILLHYSA